MRYVSTGGLAVAGQPARDMRERVHLLETRMPEGPPVRC